MSERLKCCKNLLRGLRDRGIEFQPIESLMWNGKNRVKENLDRIANRYSLDKKIVFEAMFATSVVDAYDWAFLPLRLGDPRDHNTCLNDFEEAVDTILKPKLAKIGALCFEH